VWIVCRATILCGRSAELISKGGITSDWNTGQSSLCIDFYLIQHLVRQKVHNLHLPVLHFIYILFPYTSFFALPYNLNNLFHSVYCQYTIAYTVSFFSVFGTVVCISCCTQFCIMFHIHIPFPNPFRDQSIVCCIFHSIF
jgi:hypothetical protein